MAAENSWFYTVRVVTTRSNEYIQCPHSVSVITLLIHKQQSTMNSRTKLPQLVVFYCFTKLYKTTNLFPPNYKFTGYSFNDYMLLYATNRPETIKLVFISLILNFIQHQSHVNF